MSLPTALALAASDPPTLVRRWKAISGAKAVVASPPFPAPEIFHSFGMLPVLAESAEEIRALRDVADAWIATERLTGLASSTGKPVFPIAEEWPGDIEGALDLLEAIAEWAASVSGEPISEGRLRNSLSAYRERDALVRLLPIAAQGSPGSVARQALLRCGNWLPVGTHVRLVAESLAVAPDPEGTADPEEGGDPLLRLARRTARVHHHR